MCQTEKPASPVPKLDKMEEIKLLPVLVKKQVVAQQPMLMSANDFERTGLMQVNQEVSASKEDIDDINHHMRNIDHKVYKLEDQVNSIQTDLF